ncbi:MAG: hypothetical protein A2Y64_02995 [Candidatus Coatesbacteria bacterium RBG_13_66_14]|uniref:Uncharacterized protein n=1 Tax=Candidatus Coatesbacteria bacterium RBG_13_66_14 TaxID=1817816 RepID=A0A1F5FGU1_9BACT|nr:MAG: hypothetical protein A2Y64_02995 [Candidatus Coatesbacteria bacterium RBG_13_66_14]
MASVTLKDSGCLGVFVLGVIWVGLFFTAIFTEAGWLITATSLSIPAIILGCFVGGLLGDRR